MTAEEKTPLTYKGSGVDVPKGEEVARNINDLLRGTWDNKIIPNVAGFKAVYDLDNQWVIGATDGVGTKLLVAIMANRVDTVGIDLVAMCANDISRVGAQPWFFLDYAAIGKLDKQQHYQIVQGIAEGCRRGGFPIIGGETAELPGMYDPGHFDLAGFIVGSVPKDALIDGRDVKPGATLLGIESSGIHSNGYSLAREVFFETLDLGIHQPIEELGQTVSEALLEPTTIYVKPVQDLLQKFPGQIQAMAHITGGGLGNKLPKSLPEGMGVIIDPGSWPVHPIFKYIQENGPVELDEMRNTFNMGIGYILVVNDDGVVKDLQERLKETHNLNSYDVGKTKEGEGMDYIK